MGRKFNKKFLAVFAAGAISVTAGVAPLLSNAANVMAETNIIVNPLGENDSANDGTPRVVYDPSVTSGMTGKSDADIIAEYNPSDQASVTQTQTDLLNRKSSTGSVEVRQGTKGDVFELFQVAQAIDRSQEVTKVESAGGEYGTNRDTTLYSVDKSKPLVGEVNIRPTDHFARFLSTDTYNRESKYISNWDQYRNFESATAWTDDQGSSHNYTDEQKKQIIKDLMYDFSNYIAVMAKAGKLTRMWPNNVEIGKGYDAASGALVESSTVAGTVADINTSTKIDNLPMGQYILVGFYNPTLAETQTNTGFAYQVMTVTFAPLPGATSSPVGLNDNKTPRTVQVDYTGKRSYVRNKIVMSKKSPVTVQKIANNITANGTSSIANDNTVQIGDTVRYTVAGVIPDLPDKAEYHAYMFDDTLPEGISLNKTTDGKYDVSMYGTRDLSKLTDNSASVKLTNGIDLSGEADKAAAIQQHITAKDCDFVYYYDETTRKLHAETIESDTQTYADTEMYGFVLQYNTTVNGNIKRLDRAAEAAGVTTDNSNLNTVVYSYPKNALKRADGFNTVTTTENVYSYGLELHKVDAGNKDAGIKDVEFKLYSKLDDPSTTDVNEETPLYFVEKVKGQAGAYRVANKTDEGALDHVTTGADGYIRIDGLGTAAYHVRETHVPAEYRQDLTDHQFTLVDATGKDAGKVKNIAYNGGLDTVQGSQSDGILDDTTTTVSQAGNFDRIAIDKSVLHLRITNVKTTTTNLPFTGGIGSYVFIIVGLGVMAGAVVAFFVIKRKKDSDESTEG